MTKLLLPHDHPIRAYLDDAIALIELLQEEPALIQCQELSFLRDFILENNNKGDTAIGINPVSKLTTDEMDDDGIVLTCDDDGVKTEITPSEQQPTPNENDDDANNDENVPSDIDDDPASYWDDDTNRYTYHYPPSPLNATSPLPDNNITTTIPPPSPSDTPETFECVIIGAGPAGIGLSLSLLHGGLRRSNMLILESQTVGSSFESWSSGTRFISPSFYGNPFGVLDVNAVDPLSSPALEVLRRRGGGMVEGSCQHLSGRDYAMYLRTLASRHRLPIREHTRATSIKKIVADEKWPEGYFEIDISETSSKTDVIYARFVVWCGGEWNYPRRLHPQSDFQEGSCWHYADGDYSRQFVSSIHDGKTVDGVVIVGGFEAGVDAACTLIERGVTNVTLVEATKDAWHNVITTTTGGDDDDNIIDPDPSISLSDVSINRLRKTMTTGQLRLISGWRCVGTQRRRRNDDGKDEDEDYVAIFHDLRNDNQRQELSATVPIVLCTGFDPRRSLLGSLVDWRDGGTTMQDEGDNEDGGPIVSQECDESRKCPGLFVCGPMLRHVVTTTNEDGGDDVRRRRRYGGNSSRHPLRSCRHGDSEQLKHDDNDDDEKKRKRLVIFCFIYKFRTRFALVAGEIISRLVYEDHCHYNINDDAEEEDGVGTIMTTVERKRGERGKQRPVSIDVVGHERLARLEEMLALYKDKGMLVTDLCGVTCHDQGC